MTQKAINYWLSLKTTGGDLRAEAIKAHMDGKPTRDTAQDVAMWVNTGELKGIDVQEVEPLNNKAIKAK